MSSRNDEQANLAVDTKRRLERLESRAADWKVPSMGNWKNVTFENDWSDYATGWQNAQYARDNSGFTHLRGVVKAGTVGAVMFTLPIGYRPLYEVWGIISTAAGVSALRIYTDGRCVIELGSGANATIVGLNFVFPTEGAVGMPIGVVNTPMSQYSGLHGPLLANFHRGGFMIASGIGAGGNNVPETVGVIPADLTSYHYSVHAVLGTGTVLDRVDSRPGGLVFATGTSNLLSYYGMTWPTFEVTEWTDIVLANGWVNYGVPAHDRPQFHIDKSRWVHFRGLMKSGTTSLGTTIGTLPLECRPGLKQYHRVMSNNSGCLISVDSSGNIVLEQVANNAWISLDPLHFHLS